MPPRNEPARLWAPWRMSYIETAVAGSGRVVKRAPRGGATDAPAVPDAEPCLFCRVARSRSDETDLVLARRPHALLMLNRYPYNPGHLLAVPFREVEDLPQLNAAERADLFEEIILGQGLLAAALKPDGFNVGFNLGSAVAGGSIPHLHGHIVPRWNGDNNFMPVLGQVRILPQALDATWEKLAAVAKIPIAD